jgi:hypothetical protein
MQSEAIRGNQRHSETIDETHLLEVEDGVLLGRRVEDDEA